MIMNLIAFLNIIIVMTLYTAHAVADNETLDKLNVGDGIAGESVAAVIDNQQILLSQVDKTIAKQVAKIDRDLIAIVNSSIADIIYAHYVTEAGLDWARKKKKRLNAVLRNYGGVIDDLVKKNDPQSMRLKERIAQQYVDLASLEELADRLKGEKGRYVFLPTSSSLENPLPPDLTLVKMDGIEISAGEIEEKSSFKLYELRGELYFLRKKALENIIDEFLLQRTARDTGVTESDLEHHWNTAIVSESDINEYIRTNRISGIHYESSAVKRYLEYRKRYSFREQYIVGLRNRSKITYLLKQPRQPIFSVNHHYGMYLTNGKKESIAAPVDVFYFSNYRCEQCRKTQNQIRLLIESFPNVSIKHLDFVPLTDIVALHAAILTRCSGELGKFKEMRSLLLNREPPLANGAWLSKAELNTFLRQHNVKSDAFHDCLVNPRIQDQIAAETSEALRIGFREPPAFIVSGKPFSGFQTAQDLLCNIELKNRSINQRHDCYEAKNE